MKSSLLNDTDEVVQTGERDTIINEQMKFVIKNDFGFDLIKKKKKFQ